MWKSLLGWHYYWIVYNFGQNKFKAIVIKNKNIHEYSLASLPTVETLPQPDRSGCFWKYYIASATPSQAYAGQLLSFCSKHIKTEY